MLDKIEITKVYSMEFLGIHLDRGTDDGILWTDLPTPFLRIGIVGRLHKRRNFSRIFILKKSSLNNCKTAIESCRPAFKNLKLLALPCLYTLETDSDLHSYANYRKGRPNWETQDGSSRAFAFSDRSWNCQQLAELDQKCPHAVGIQISSKNNIDHIAHSDSDSWGGRGAQYRLSCEVTVTYIEPVTSPVPVTSRPRPCVGAAAVLPNLALSQYVALHYYSHPPSSLLCSMMWGTSSVKMPSADKGPDPNCSKR
ncbi:hypothetical protein J6590_044941 [Homalodisca vitripennis]|nr:hypothetical protein J6590_044941 [Homalodisca vitripennis]